MKIVRRGWGFVLAFIFFLLIYRSVPSFNFVWDDVSVIVNNPVFDGPVLSGFHLTQNTQLNPDFQRSTEMKAAHDSLRPFLFVHFWLEKNIFGWNSAIFHLVSIFWSFILIAMACLLFFSLTKNLRSTNIFAVLVSSHPFLIEPTAYVSARSDILSVLFSILSAYFFFNFVKTQKQIFTVLSCFFFLTALGFKESAILLPIIFGVFLVRNFSARTSKLTAIYFLVTIGLYLAWRMHIAQTAESGPIISSVIHLPNYWLQYLLHFFIPFEISTERIPLEISPILGWSAILLLFCFLGLKRWFAMMLIILASFILLWPSSIGIEIFGAVADRYFLFSCLILCGLLAFVFDRQMILYPKRVGVILSFLLCGWLMVSLNSVSAWQNNFQLFMHAAKQSGTASAYYRLSTTVSDEQAIPLLEKAYQMDSSNPRVINNLGVMYLRLGKISESERILSSGTKLGRTLNPNIWFNLGLVYLRKGNVEGACLQFREAILLVPGYQDALNQWKKFCVH